MHLLWFKFNQPAFELITKNRHIRPFTHTHAQRLLIYVSAYTHSWGFKNDFVFFLFHFVSFGGRSHEPRFFHPFHTFDSDSCTCVNFCSVYRWCSLLCQWMRSFLSDNAKLYVQIKLIALRALFYLHCFLFIWCLNGKQQQRQKWSEEEINQCKANKNVIHTKNTIKNEKASSKEWREFEKKTITTKTEKVKSKSVYLC